VKRLVYNEIDYSQREVKVYQRYQIIDSDDSLADITATIQGKDTSQADAKKLDDTKSRVSQSGIQLGSKSMMNSLNNSTAGGGTKINVGFTDNKAPQTKLDEEELGNPKFKEKVEPVRTLRERLAKKIN
jgi:hypothetical protein